MKKIRNLKKKKKELKKKITMRIIIKKTNKHTRLKNAHLLCIGAIFHRILTPTTHSCSPELVKTDFNQFNQAEIQHKPTDKQLRLLSFSLYHSYKNDV